MYREVNQILRNELVTGYRIFFRKRIMAEKRKRDTCSICQENFTKPKIISCFHTFCEKCLENHIQNTAQNSCFSCPVCRKVIAVPKGGVAEFSYNFYIEEEYVKVKRREKVINCDICEEEYSNYRCVECGQYLCDACKDKHDQFSGCIKHTVFSLDDETEVKLQEKRHFCTEHETEELDFYCETCTLSICLKCLMANHKDHKTPQLKDCAEAVKVELTKLQTELEERHKKIDGYVASIDKKISEMRDSKTETCKKIDEQVQKICDAITALGNESKKEVETTCDEEEQKMNKIIENMKNLSRQMEATIEHLKQILKKNSVVENINVLPKIKSEKAEKCSTDLPCLPRVVTEYKTSKVSLVYLSSYLGKLSILRGPTFQHKFTLYNPYIARRYDSAVYRIDDLPWFLRIDTNRDNDRVNIGLYLYLGDHPTVQSVTARIKLELLQASDRTRLCTKEDNTIFSGTTSLYEWKDVTTTYGSNYYFASRQSSVAEKCFLVQANVIIENTKTK
ncbi:tripartite motif-containing protein 3 [Patella vulgata]|uniref:tripartite motif-containing protein 3 n=1 Tax=Patella vulgata TaxID=6465 RepID=UPI0024A9877F|nr:tripartite motif-containing protein 3 [Patella vulgata]